DKMKYQHRENAIERPIGKSQAAGVTLTKADLGSRVAIARGCNEIRVVVDRLDMGDIGTIGNQKSKAPGSTTNVKHALVRCQSGKVQEHLSEPAAPASHITIVVLCSPRDVSRGHSLQRDLGGADHLAPLLGLGGKQLAERGGRE